MSNSNRIRTVLGTTGVLVLALLGGSLASETGILPPGTEVELPEVTPEQWAVLQAGEILLAREFDPQTVFADGFESGDTSAWSVTVP